MTAFSPAHGNDGIHARRVWTAAALIAFVAHLSIVVALVRKPAVMTTSFAGSPIAMLDFAPIAAAPDPATDATAPGPLQAAQARIDATPVQPKPVEHQIEPTPPDLVPPKDAVILPKPEPPKPETPRTASAAPVEASAPPPAAQRAPVAAGPMQGDADGKRQREITDWQVALIRQINKFRHFVRGVDGLVVVAFTIGRDGQLAECRVLQSSGNLAIDREAVANIHRASPMPRPPGSVDEAQLSFSLPLRYRPAH